MRRLLAISFAFMLFTEAFLPNMDLCELKKVENLFEHYQESREKNKISFIDFLAQHYGNQKAKDHHQDEHDENLPFQGPTCCQTPLFVSAQLNFSCSVIVPVTPKKYTVYTAPVASEFPDSIFQPPKA